MHTKSIALSLFLLWPMTGLAQHGESAAPERKTRLMVDEFDYSRVRPYVARIFGSDAHVGKGIRALLVTRIIQGNHFVIVERPNPHIAANCWFCVGNQTQRGGRPIIANSSAAEACLTADITIFGHEDWEKKLPESFLPRPAVGDWGRRSKAVLALTYSLVDTGTLEVVASGQVRGESKRQSDGWDGLLAGAGAAADVAATMESAGFTETILGEAVVDCVDKLAGILTESESNLAARKVEVAALVADVSGSAITITAGSNQGLQVGQQLAVERLLCVLPDPATRRMLDPRRQPIGTLVISEVRERIAIGTFTGSVPPKLNDVVLSTSSSGPR